jgi:hypothetical protein
MVKLTGTAGAAPTAEENSENRTTSEAIKLITLRDDLFLNICPFLYNLKFGYNGWIRSQNLLMAVSGILTSLVYGFAFVG